MATTTTTSSSTTVPSSIIFEFLDTNADFEVAADSTNSLSRHIYERYKNTFLPLTQIKAKREKIIGFQEMETRDINYTVYRMTNNRLLLAFSLITKYQDYDKKVIKEILETYKCTEKAQVIPEITAEFLFVHEDQPVETPVNLQSVDLEHSDSERDLTPVKKKQKRMGVKDVTPGKRRAKEVMTTQKTYVGDVVYSIYLILEIRVPKEVESRIEPRFNFTRFKEIFLEAKLAIDSNDPDYNKKMKDVYTNHFYITLVIFKKLLKVLITLNEKCRLTMGDYVINPSSIIVQLGQQDYIKKVYLLDMIHAHKTVDDIESEIDAETFEEKLVTIDKRKGKCEEEIKELDLMFSKELAENYSEETKNLVGSFFEQKNKLSEEIAVLNNYKAIIKITFERWREDRTKSKKKYNFINRFIHHFEPYQTAYFFNPKLSEFDFFQVGEDSIPDIRNLMKLFMHTMKNMFLPFLNKQDFISDYNKV
jgi:hypothetical protein